MEILFNNVDIVIFFFITVLVVHRLYLVLGSRQGHEVDVNQSRFEKKNKQVKPKSTDNKPSSVASNIQKELEDSNSAASVYKKMLYIEKVFSDFEYVDFIKQRQDDFLGIISAYHSKNLSAVKSKIIESYYNILSKSSFLNKENTSFKLNEFKEVDIADVIFEESAVKVSIKFNTDYKISVNETNKTIEEDNNNLEYWLFVRGYKDLQWKLLNIKNEQN